MDNRIEAAIQRVLQNHCCPQPSQNSGLTHHPKNPSLLRPMSRKFLQPLEEITSVQDNKDRELDQNDLRQQMDNALQSGSDSTMLEFLQIPREDILEAIKSMQRHLEKTGPGAQSSTDGRAYNSRDTLEREFIETGIDSLRRMSKSSTNLPSWTITRYALCLWMCTVLTQVKDSRLIVPAASGLDSFRTYTKELGAVKLSQSKSCEILLRAGSSFVRPKFGRTFLIRTSLSCWEQAAQAEIHLGFLSVLSQNMGISAITYDDSAW